MAALGALRVVIGPLGYEVSFLGLLPIVVAAFWLGPAAAWIVAIGGLAPIVGGQLVTAPASFVESGQVPVTVIRLITFCGVAALVNALLARERAAVQRATRAMERAQAERAGRAASDAAAARLRALVGGVAAVVWEADARNGEFTFVSERAEDLLGYPPQDWLDDPGFWPRIVHPDDRERAIRTYRRGVAEETDFDFAYRAVAADGTVVWLHDVVHVVRDADGPAHLHGVLVDVTQQQRRERAATMLAEAGRLAAGPGEVPDRLAAVAALTVGELCDVAIIRLRGPDGRYRPVAAAPPDLASAVLEWSPIAMPPSCARPSRPVGRSWSPSARTR